MMQKLFLIIASALSFITTLEANTFKTEEWTTANGARVVFYQAMEVPMLDINIAFAAGSSYDGERFGLSALTSELLSQGSGSFNAMQIAEQFADIGAQFNADSSRDMAVLQLKTLTSDDALKPAIDTFSLILNKPAFTSEAFEQEKNQQLMAIQQMRDSPGELANLAFFNKLYREHPYAHAIKGTPKTVKDITLENVRDFYTRYFVSKNAVIIMVGAIDNEKAHQIAEQLTQNLSTGESAPAIPKATPLTKSEKVVIDYPSSQTMLRFGQIAIDHKVPDYFPLMVGNYILGGGALVSRLSLEVREKRGLTYGITSQFMPMPGEGPFLISLSTRSKQASAALKVAEDTLSQFLATGPSEEELVAAKQYMIGSFPLSLASNTNIAGMLLRMAFYNLPKDFLDNYTARIQDVTAAEIKKAFDTHIHLNKMLYVSVGKIPVAVP